MSVGWAEPERSAVIPGWLILSPVSHPALRLYAYLALHVGEKSPTHAQIAEDCRLTLGAVKNAFDELEALGALDRKQRDYRLRLNPGEPADEPPAPLPVVQHDTIDKPPAIPKVGGRNLALDALCVECGITDGSPRIKAATAALYGRRGGDGITHLAWKEARRGCEQNGSLTELARVHNDGAAWSRLLARAIQHRAGMIRAKQPWRGTITPQLIRDLWYDINLLPDPAPRHGGLTPEQAAQVR